MPNTFEYADWLAMTALDILESKRAVSQFFNTEYNRDFKQKFPVGDTIRVPYPQQFTVRTGLPYNPQAINARHTSISFDEPFGIDFEWDSAESYLKAPKGREEVERRYIRPAMSQLATEIDMRCATFAAQNAASVVGALGTDPTTYDGTSAAARQIMVELGNQGGERGLIVPPSVMRAVKTANLALFNPVSDISKQFRNGLIGYADGFEWYEGTTLRRHTAGTWAGAVTVTTTQTGTAAINSLALTATTGDTFKKGDKFSIANVLPVHPQTRQAFGTTAKTFTILADVTAAASAATISFSPDMYGPGSQYQNVDALPVATAALTLWPGTTSPNGKVGNLGLALADNAFAMVSAELEEPKSSSVELVSQKRDPDSGVSVRFPRDWDSRESKFINRFDVMLGFGVLYNDSGAVVIAAK